MAAVGLKMYRKKDGKEDKRRERARAVPKASLLLRRFGSVFNMLKIKNRKILALIG